MKRIDQWLANLGYCSRREAKQWVGDGRIRVRGQVIYDSGMRCAAADVLVDGETLDHPDGLLLLMNKPAGVSCSHDSREAPLVFDLLSPRWRARNPPLATVGRLDRDTTGLLLITDQSPLVHALTSPKYKIPKTYQVTLSAPVPPARQTELTALFAAGTLLLADDPAPCLPAQLSWTGPNSAHIVLMEGRYHQIKRMFGASALDVVALHRSHFGSLPLPDPLPPGVFMLLALDHRFI